MKTYLTYGFAMALAGGLLTLALFFLGYHTDPEKLETAQWISLPLFIAIAAVIIVLGTKARQAEVPASEPFGYGRALGAGVMIVLFSSLFGIVINFVYFQYINPEFVDVMVQVQTDKLENQGVGSSQIEQMEKGMRMMMKPPLLAFFGFVQAMIGGTLIALITAAFLRRPASAEPPAIA
jgi:hypothetical protein